MVGGLFDSIAGQQAKPAVKHFSGNVAIAGGIGYRPVAQAAKLIIILQYISGDISRLECGVAEQLSVADRSIPLRDMEVLELTGQTSQTAADSIKTLFKCGGGWAVGETCAALGIGFDLNGIKMELEHVRETVVLATKL